MFRNHQRLLNDLQNHFLSRLWNPLLAFCVSLWISSAQAYQLTVVDQTGAPLANAVVELQASPQLTSIEVTSIETASIETTPFIMDQIDKAFVPHVLMIPKNGLVEFPNSDNIRHHVYSFSKPKPFELRLYSGKPEAPIRFENPGIVVLGCNIHDSMVGYIYVSDHSITYQSNQNGRIQLDALPDALERAYIWHPNLSQGIDQRIELSLEQLSPEHPIQLDIIKPAPRNTFEARFKRKLN